MSIRTKRNSRRFIAAAAAVAVAASTFATTSSPISATSTVAATRVAGADRYATSVAIANAMPPATTVGINAGAFVIASGDNYPDALAASALAGSIGARVILVPSSGVLSAGAITLLATGTDIRIIGGSAAISTALETNLQLVSPAGPARTSAQFKRVSGATRYETAAAVAAEIASSKVASVGLKRTAIVVSGENFADAVLAAPVAFRGPSSSGLDAVHPVLLTRPNNLDASAQQRLISLGVQQVVIIGGTSAVSAAVASSIEALGIDVIRVGGSNRYETATALAAVLTSSEAAGGFGWPKTASGLANLTPEAGGADALASAGWFGLNRAPLIGTAGTELPSATSAWLDSNKATMASLLVAGGVAAVPATVVEAARTSAGLLARPTATIAALEGNSIATVTFSEAVTLASAGSTANYAAITAAGPLNTLSTVSYNATTRTATLTFAAALAIGTTLRVLNGAIVTADARSVAQTDLVIAADTTAPTATVTALIGSAAASGNNNVVAVDFDKPVSSVTGLSAAISVNGIDVGSTAVVSLAGTQTSTNSGVAFNRAVFTLASPMAVGQTVTFKAAQVRILGAAGALTAGRNVAASATVTSDLVRPSVAGVPTYTVTHTPAQQSVDGRLLLTANKPLTLGVNGNAVRFEAVSASAGTVPGSVSVSVSAGTSPVIGGPAADITFHAFALTASNSALALAAAINANVSASALVTASVLGGGGVIGTLPAAPITMAALTGGKSVVVVTVTFTEAIGTTNQITMGSGRTASTAAGVTLTAGTTTAPFLPGATTVAYTIDLTSAAARTDLPQASGSTIWYADTNVTDMAGNRILTRTSATGLPIVAG